VLRRGLPERGAHHGSHADGAAKYVFRAYEQVPLFDQDHVGIFRPGVQLGSLRVAVASATATQCINTTANGFSITQQDGEANYAVRAAGNPAALFTAIRGAVREVDPTLAVLDLRTQDDQLARMSAQERLFARVSGFFGVVALALAGVGLYGLTSYMVVRRTGEFGVRMALGALPRQVLALVLRESLSLVAAGIVLGLTAAYAASGVVAAMLFGLSPVDLVTYSAVPLVLLAVALAASLLPARRATQVNPVVALRAE